MRLREGMRIAIEELKFSEEVDGLSPTRSLEVANGFTVTLRARNGL
jgi:hypothetical protein